jgi:hypothetical protein
MEAPNAARQEATARPSRRSTVILLVALALGCAAVAIVLMFPGYVNGDSEWQLAQARSGHFNDLHPALLSYLWRYLDRIIPGAGGMFVFSELLFWSGLVAFAYHALGSLRKTALVVPLFFAHLPLMLAFQQIGKDATLVAVLVLVVGMLITAERQGSRAALVTAWLSMVLAYGVRRNAVFAIIPLVAWLAAIVRDRFLAERFRAPLKRLLPFLALTAAITGAVVAAHTAVMRLVVRPEPGLASQVVTTFDIVGVSVLTRENYLPRLFDRERRPLDLAELDRIYDPSDGTPLLWNPPGLRGPGFVWNERESNVLLGHWFGAVISQPRAYLTHRARLFKAVLNLGVKYHYPYWLPSFRTVGTELHWNAHLKAWMIRISERHRDAWPFKAWPYLLASLLLAAISLTPGAAAPRALWALFFSIVGYEGAYFFVAPNSHFRYSWWIVAAAPLLALLVPFGPALAWFRRGLAALKPQLGVSGSDRSRYAPPSG